MSESQEEDGKGALPHPYHPLHPPRPVSARPGYTPGGGHHFPGCPVSMRPILMRPLTMRSLSMRPKTMRRMLGLAVRCSTIGQWQGVEHASKGQGMPDNRHERARSKRKVCLFPILPLTLC